nr:cytochrome b [uncultured Shimia sp.]
MAHAGNYGVVSRFNHWFIGFGMIGMLAFGIYLEKFAPDGPDKGALIGTHKAIGVLLLILGVWRVGYRLYKGFMADAAPMPAWQSLSAKIVHWILLVSVLAMPLTGVFGSYFGGRATSVFGVFTIPAAMEPSKAIAGVMFNMHGAFAMLTIVCLVLHVVGALKHHVIDRDDTLKRMVGKA